MVAHNLDPETDAAAGEDPDQDGLKNIVEFFFGMDPTGSGEPNQLPLTHHSTSGPAGIVFEIVPSPLGNPYLTFSKSSAAASRAAAHDPKALSARSLHHE